MALSMYFRPDSLTTEQYDQVGARLAEAGLETPAGRLYHCAITADNGCLCIFDVWESQEAFDAFAQAARPIMDELGVKAVKPAVHEIHNAVAG